MRREKTWLFKFLLNIEKMKNRLQIGILVFAFFLLLFKAEAQKTDFSGYRIVCVEKNNPQVLKAVTVLKEEIAKRSRIQLPVLKKCLKIC